jgi:hypothetical protein
VDKNISIDDIVARLQECVPCQDQGDLKSHTNSFPTLDANKYSKYSTHDNALFANKRTTSRLRAAIEE